MSHVDEGALHAYLDGALDEYPSGEARRIREHLDTCGQCATRLEAERKLRSDAHAMLGLAAPDVEMPSLEELRAYVQRTRPRAGRFSVRIYRMGWAASVVLALGAGWLLRGDRLQSPALEREAPAELAEGFVAADAEDRAGSQQQAVPAEMAEGEAPADRLPGVTRAAAAATLAESVPAVAEEVAAFADRGSDATGGRADGAPSAQTVVSADMDVAPTELMRQADSVRAIDVLDQTVAAAPSTGLLAEAEASKAREAGVAERDALGAEALRRAVSEPAAVGGASAMARALDVIAVPDDPAAPLADRSRPPQNEEERRRAEVPLTLTSEMSTTGAAARETEDESDVLAGGPLQSVDGYDVLYVTNVVEGTTFVGGRTVQRLDDGRTFEVFHLEPEVDPTVLGDPSEGVKEVRRESEVGWVVVRGAITERELTELLEKLFPET